MIAIVEYNAGNSTSVQMALKRLGVTSIRTSDAEMIQRAEKVIFPGVGEAKSAMRFLKTKQLDTVIAGLNQPVLGICLGMQLLCSHTEENDTDCLNIIPARVKKFPSTGIVPHTGWNNFTSLKTELFNQIQLSDDVYFVHSFYVPECEFTIAATDYLIPFSAAIANNNFYATQFHPEKSGRVGQQILKNFIQL